MIHKFNEFDTRILETYFIDNKCTSEYVISVYFSGNINESITLNLKDKIVNFFKKIISYGKKYFNKFIELINSLVKFFERFKKSNPTLYKFIIYTCLFVVIMMLSNNVGATEIIVNNGSVKLSVTNIEKCNAAISWIDSVLSKTNSYDSKVLLEAKYYLNDLKDGKIDSVGMLNNQSMAIGKSALKYIEMLIDDANSSQDKAMMGKIIEYVKDGSRYIIK